MQGEGQDQLKLITLSNLWLKDTESLIQIFALGRRNCFPPQVCKKAFQGESDKPKSGLKVLVLVFKA